MFARKFFAIIAFCLAASPALAREQGTGFYAANCQNPSPGFEIKIRSNGTADVKVGNKSYRNVMTSYSYYGSNTPRDFHLAILFQPGNSPLPDYKGQSGRIEIWKGENSFYALRNGRPNKKLLFCAASAREAGVRQPSGPKIWIVSNVPANDVLNVRAGPSTKYKIVGALGNGDSVSQVGDCKKSGSSTWCKVRMGGDMPFSGWVNARYLD